MNRTRRELITGGAGMIALTTFAGCLGDDEDSGDAENDDYDDHSHDDHHDDHDDHDHDDHSHDDHHDDHAHDDHDHDHHAGHFDELGIYEFQLLDRAHDPHKEISYMHGDHWHGAGDFPVVPEGDNLSIGATAYDEDGEDLELWEDYELRAAVASGADDEVVSFDFHGDHVHIHGEEDGMTEIVFQVWHDDHADYQTAPLAVIVGEDTDDDHDDE